MLCAEAPDHCGPRGDESLWRRRACRKMQLEVGCEMPVVENAVEAAELDISPFRVICVVRLESRQQ